MKFLDKTSIDEVERHIAPPLRLAITIPVEERVTEDGIGAPTDYVIYVGVSDLHGRRANIDEMRRLADRLTLREED